MTDCSTDLQAESPKSEPAPNAIRHLSVTTFRSKSAKDKTESWVTEADLAEAIANPKTYSHKELMPLVKLARFGWTRSGKDSLRHNGNLIDVCGVEGDYDGEIVPMQTAASICEQAGIRALFYTSPSHTQDKPRWRVLAPLSKAYPKGERKRFVARLNGLLGGILAGESFTLSQTFYIGHVNGAVYQHADVDGDYIDTRAELDARAIYGGKKDDNEPTGDFSVIQIDQPSGLVPDDAFGELMSNKLFAATWKKAESSPTDNSVVCFQLAKDAIRAGWSHQDTAELIYLWRSEYANKDDKLNRLDWFKRTIHRGQHAVDDERVELIDFGVAKDSMQPISARDLYGMHFDPLHWNIQDVLPAGTTLLFGKPKKGKSFLTLMIAICVAAGRPVFGKETSGRPVLYLGLEDSERRAQRRVKGCASALDIPPDDFIDKLFISTSSKRADNGLFDELRAWLTDHPNTGLIVIDMLKKVTGAEDNRKSLYAQQSAFGDVLTKFSHDHPELSIVVVHHSRKAESDDPFDLVSGTTGLSGSYDTLAAISDVSGSRMLCMTGRDIEGAEIPLLMNERGMYTLEGVTAEEARTKDMSDTRRAVYDAVPEVGTASRKDIIAASRLSEGLVDQMLRRMLDGDLVEKVTRGNYRRTDIPFFDEPTIDIAAIVDSAR